MSDENSNTFDVIVRQGADDDSQVVERGGEFIRLSQYLNASKVTVPADTLSSNVKEFVGKLQGVLSNPPDDTGSFRVESITVTAEISAK